MQTDSRRGEETFERRMSSETVAKIKNKESPAVVMV